MRELLASIETGLGHERYVLHFTHNYASAYLEDEDKCAYNRDVFQLEFASGLIQFRVVAETLTDVEENFHREFWRQLLEVKEGRHPRQVLTVKANVSTITLADLGL